MKPPLLAKTCAGIFVRGLMAFLFLLIALFLNGHTTSPAPHLLLRAGSSDTILDA